MYRLELNYISRNGGKVGKRDADKKQEHGFSAVAAIAYRTASIVTDNRTGEVHDYRRKRRVGHSEIILPAGAPAWATHREALWNAAEAAEPRKDARLANEFIVCLPYGLTCEQEIELVRDLAQSITDRHGVAVEFAIHEDNRRRWDGTDKGIRGRHAHLLMTTRALTGDGLSKAKAREFTDHTLGPQTLRYWRERWAIIGNKHLERADLDERWDHRTLKAQHDEALERGDLARAAELDRAPGVHLGPMSTALERKGVNTWLGDRLRAILAENALRQLDREMKETKASIAALELRLRELHDEQEAEDAAEVCTEDGDDLRWAVFEDTFMRRAQELDLSFGEMTRALPAFKAQQFPAYMDAAEKQGWTPETLAREFAQRMLEEDRQRMHEQARRDDPLPESELDRDFDAPSP